MYNNIFKSFDKWKPRIKALLATFILSGISMARKPLLEYVRKVGNVPEAVRKVISRYNHNNVNASGELYEPFCDDLENFRKTKLDWFLRKLCPYKNHF